MNLNQNSTAFGSTVIAEFLLALDDDSLVREQVLADFKSRWPEHADKLADLGELHQLGPSPDLSCTAPFLPDDDDFPPRVGPYEIIREIGRGGMGRVLLGRHVDLDQLRAIKILKPGATLDRFLNEQRCLAKFDNEASIISVFEVGRSDEEGIPYLAMPYIDGATLNDVVYAAAECRTKSVARLSTASSLAELTELSLDQDRARGRVGSNQKETRPANGLRLTHSYYQSVARCLVGLAQAIQVSHERGVVHRDLKPENIMVDTQGRAWIIDFGLASSINDQSESAQGIAGTIEYMAPEQFRGEFGPWTDVWGIGTILYELLTFRRAFRLPDDGSGASESESRARFLRQLGRHRQLRDAAPPAPRSLDARIPVDLEAICNKCLQREPAKRYRNAQALADDLTRWLEHRPVEARQPTVLERLGKWTRRHPVTAATLVFVAVILVAGVAGLAADRVRIQTRERRLSKNDYARIMSLGYESLRNARMDLVVDLLHEPFRLDNGTDLRGIEWYLLNAASQRQLTTLIGHQADVDSLAYDPNGKFLYSGDQAGRIKVWDRATGHCVQTIEAHERAVHTIAVSSDGKQAVTGGGDALAAVWSLPEWKRQRVMGMHVMDVRRAVFVPGLPTAVVTSSDDGTVFLWDTETGEAIAAPLQHDGVVVAMDISSDGGRIATLTQRRFGSGATTIMRVWDVTTGKDLLQQAFSSELAAVRFSQDGMLVAAGRNGVLHAWNTQGETLKPISGNAGMVAALEFDPSGRTLFVAEENSVVTVYHVDLRRKLRSLRGHSDSVRCLAVDPQGEELASGGEDFTIRTWPVDDPSVLLGHVSTVTGVSLSPDGGRVASSSHDQSIKVWDTTTGEVVFEIGKTKIGRDSQGNLTHVDVTGGHGSLVADVTFDHAGRRLASGGFDLAARIWDAQTGQQLHRLAHGGQVVAVAFSADDRLLATASWDDTVCLWDVASGNLVQRLHGHTDHAVDVCFSPAGNQLASVGRDGTLRIWQVDTGETLATIAAHRGWARSVDYSPDGRLLATGGADQTVRIWNAVSLQVVHTLRGHTSGIDCVAFHPDGKRLASSSSAQHDRTVRIWDLELGLELARLPGQRAIGFSPDGWRIAFAGPANTVEVYDAQRGAQLAVPSRTRVPIAESAPATLGELPATGGLRVLGYFTSDRLRSARRLNDQHQPPEGATFLVIVCSIPRRLMSLTDEEYARVVADREGQPAPPRMRMSQYRPQQFELVEDDESVAASLIAAWPDRLGFHGGMTQTRSQNLDPGERVLLALAWPLRTPLPESLPKIRLTQYESLPVPEVRLRPSGGSLIDR